MILFRLIILDFDLLAHPNQVLSIDSLKLLLGLAAIYFQNQVDGRTITVLSQKEKDDQVIRRGGVFCHTPFLLFTPYSLRNYSLTRYG